MGNPLASRKRTMKCKLGLFRDSCAPFASSARSAQQESDLNLVSTRQRGRRAGQGGSKTATDA